MINTITVTHDKPQTGTSNVNIYANDLKLRIKGKEQRKADRERLRTIGDALVAYLDAQNIADLEYWIESDIVIKELVPFDDQLQVFRQVLQQFYHDAASPV